MNNRKSFTFGNGHQHHVLRHGDAGSGGGVAKTPTSPSRRTNSLVFSGDLLSSISPITSIVKDGSCDSSNDNDKLKVIQQESEIKHLQQILNEVIAQRNALLCEVEQLKLQAVVGELCQIDRPTSSIDESHHHHGFSSGLGSQHTLANNSNENSTGNKKQEDGGAAGTVEKTSNHNQDDGSGMDELDQSFSYLEPEMEFSLICQDLIGMSVDDSLNDSKLR